MDAYKNLLFYVFPIYHVLSSQWMKYVFPSRIQVVPKVVDPVVEYMETQKAMLLACSDKTTKNENVDPVFYNKRDYQFLLMDSKNRYETLWKTRILFASTPRGNIIMYYDVYKLGFAYYCDSQSIPYPLLNAVAMKYVRQFRCLDFFMDDQALPASPLISILLTEEKKAGSGSAADPIDGPFAKLKTYSKTSKKIGEHSNTGTEPTKEGTTNRFLCQGKIHNFKLLQTPKVKSAMVKDCASKLFENFQCVHPVEVLVKDTDHPGSEISYKNYKTLRNRTILLEAPSAVA
jgi:hypothetical protein